MYVACISPDLGWFYCQVPLQAIHENAADRKVLLTLVHRDKQDEDRKRYPLCQ